MPISSTEILVIIFVILIVVGPDKMPSAAAQLGRAVRRGKQLVQDAKAHLREELGDELKDVNLKSFDPRQYDPRKIVRDALRDDPDLPAAPGGAGVIPAVGIDSTSRVDNVGTYSATPPAQAPTSGWETRPHPYMFTPGRPAPFDSEAT
ncbi:MAG: twin-arginine translocase TatA/TatE family subunit [Bowdeniella nasicola]|nr:twin-arginine translocase TatA/TatE family subunit [Bowdeniella nasicola]